MNNKIEFFTLDDEVAYAGFDSGGRWNGFDCPLFELSVIYKILADLSEEGYDFATIDDVIYLWYPDEEMDEEPMEIYADKNGLYAIGNYGWVWQKV